jgi:cobaltochelatase CobS
MYEKLIDEVEKLLGSSGRIEITQTDPALAGIIADLPKAKARLELSQKKHIVVDMPSNGSSVITIYRIGSNKPAGQVPAPVPAPAVQKPIEHKAAEPKKVPTIKRSQHTYIPPRITDEIISVLTDEASHIIQLVGPTQCGKSTLVKHIAKVLGRKLYQINCRGDMGSEAFFGEKTVTIDDATKQNKIMFQKGTVEQGLVEGLDEQGNEVGEPAILFVDEAPAAPAHIIHGLNRVFESDEAKRTLVINEDGGRVVKSHSGLRIIIAGNTVGRGANTAEESMYAAQRDALDISLLNRVAVTFRMGYDRDVEKHIVSEKIGDDKIAALLLKFRDAIRSQVKAGKLTSPFSTKRIIDISNMYRIFRNLGKAIFYVCFEQLLPEEKPVYNEHAVAILGMDLLKEYTDTRKVDY